MITYYEGDDSLKTTECQHPVCKRRVPHPKRKGRPRKYCSVNCKQLAYKRRVTIKKNSRPALKVDYS